MRFGKKVIFLPSFWLLCRDTNSRKLNLYRHFQPSPKLTQGFPGGSSGKEPTCQCRRPNRQGFYPWIGKIPWKRVRQPTPVFLPGESHEQFSTQQAYISSIQSLSRVRLFVTPWVVACQAPLSMGFSRQEYWSGLPYPPQRDLLDPGIEPPSLTSPALAGGSFYH